MSVRVGQTICCTTRICPYESTTKNKNLCPIELRRKSQNKWENMFQYENGLSLLIKCCMEKFWRGSQRKLDNCVAKKAAILYSFRIRVIHNWRHPKIPIFRPLSSPCHPKSPLAQQSPEVTSTLVPPLWGDVIYG